jgi:L-histidine Nalpha-methyltransferase
MKIPLFIQLYREDHAAIRQELIYGLSSNPQLGGAFTSPKYLYDALGSKLFEAITELPEYYPTRTEASIFVHHKADMARHIPPAAQLIDLGAGNCNKAAGLFDHFNPSRYVAVDISVDFLRSSIECLQRQYPELDMFGVGMDFSSALDLPVEVLTADKPVVLFYPGSSIGNFTPDEALVFLKQAHGLCMNQGPDRSNQHSNDCSTNEANSGILLGVDLVKGVAQLEAAYDDALGVTAAFNRNLLLHINRLVGTNFNLSDWSHVAHYNEARARIEMHLVAQRDVTLAWDGGSRQFVTHERIHTENSYKWTVPGFAKLLQAAGFQVPTVWTDDAMQFAVMWARA